MVDAAEQPVLRKKLSHMQVLEGGIRAAGCGSDTLLAFVKP